MTCRCRTRERSRCGTRLANTIADEHLTLYLILDEAHRGMKPPSTGDRAEKATIVQRLVNGANGVPPGADRVGDLRHGRALQRRDGQGREPDQLLSRGGRPDAGAGIGFAQGRHPARLSLAEAGRFDTVLLARATKKGETSHRAVACLRAAGRRSRGGGGAALGRAGAKQAVGPTPPVGVRRPSGRPGRNSSGTQWRTCSANTPRLTSEGSTVPHVGPETVQDRTHVRVLFAKDAISTGWDCPRAEVLVSFRPARDDTHITQLLGRMVRTPLARRVPGNDLLNSVECVLPHFDRSTAARVATSMLGDREQDEDGTGGGAGRRVLLAPADMDVNQAIPEAVWEAFDALPSQTLPRKAARPVRRLSALAQALPRDGLRANARKDAYQKIFAKLDGLLAQHKQKVAAASKGILRVEGETLVARVVGGEVRDRETFVEAADEQSVEADFKAASRVFTADLARKYADHLATGDEDDDGLFDAHVKVAALAQVDGVSGELDREADELGKKWFGEVPGCNQGACQTNAARFTTRSGACRPESQVIEIKRPRIRTEETEDADGNKLETRTGHLMSDGNGDFPISSLNQWEIDVLDKEMGHSGFLAWYRNPSRPSVDALVIVYQNAQGNWRRMCPDFLFFHGDTENMKVSIVDPHGHHLADALPKLCGLAEFAATHGESFHRIESVAGVQDGTLRVLDLTDRETREAVAVAEDTEALYLGGSASSY